MKLFGNRRKPTGPPQADVPTVQLENPPPPAVDTAMATHIGTRAYQQDAAFVTPPVAQGDGLAFAILCDGMGGMEDGEAASSEVASYMANAISALPPDGDAADLLLHAAQGANEMLLCYNRAHSTEAGTTLCAVVIQAGCLFWVGVGDSRIYILRGQEMARLTRDHNFAIHLQKMVERGQITQQQADEDPRREALVSYIGAPELEEVDISQSPFPLHTGDLILLCSDGLTKSLDDGEILRLLMENGGPLGQTAALLTGAAFDSGTGGKDNTTVILMRYNDTGQQPNPDPAQQNQRSEEDEPGEM